MSGPAGSSRLERALRWSALGTVARFALQLGAQVALARVLGPHAYGVYGIGLAAVTFAGFLAGNAFSWRLILQPAIDTQEVRLAFTWQSISGIAAALVLAGGATALAGFFQEPALESVLRWMALACALNAVAGTALCIAQRELRFRALAVTQSLAYVAGYLIVGLPLALAGWQAQALALACVVQAAVTLVILIWIVPHPMRPLLRHPASTDTARTGRTVFITNLVNWLLGNLDRLVIARLLGAQATGLYTLAWNLSQVPVTLMMGSIQPALLAAGTAIAHDDQALRQRWQLALSGALVVMPAVAAVLSLLAPDLVQMLYGSEWSQAGWLLGLMLACLPAWCAWGLSTPLLWNTGHSRQEAGLQLPLLPLALLAWWALAPAGLAWAAGVSVLLLHLRAVVTLAAVRRLLPVPIDTLAGMLARGLALALACVAAAMLARMGFNDPALRILAGAAAALACGWGLAAWRPAWLGPQAHELLSGVVPFVRPATPRWSVSP